MKSVTILIVALLTLINYRSTRSGGNVQVIFTILKIMAIAIIAIGLLFSGEGHLSNLFEDSKVIVPVGWAFIAAIVAATSGAFWGYDGWNNITFVAGEIRDPQRNIPKSLLLGLLVCIITYALITLAYEYVLPIDKLATSAVVASDAAMLVMGTAGGGIIALMVIISTLEQRTRISWQQHASHSRWRRTSNFLPLPERFTPDFKRRVTHSCFKGSGLPYWS